MIDKLELLKNDDEYYNGAGRFYLSNSNIDMMMRTPKLYLDFINGKYTPEFQTNFVIGNATHSAILGGLDKLDSEYVVLNVATRNNKEFKECDAPRDKILLDKEYELVNNIYDRLDNLSKYNEDVFNLITQFTGDVEVPMIHSICGVDWKMKADKVTSDTVYDLKTTSDIAKFKYSAFNYGYNSQAFLYSQAFGKPMKFVAVDKNTLEVEVFDCSDKFLSYGAERVEMASLFYNEYIKPAIESGNTDKIDSLVNYSTL